MNMFFLHSNHIVVTQVIYALSALSFKFYILVFTDVSQTFYLLSAKRQACETPIICCS